MFKDLFKKWRCSHTWRSHNITNVWDKGKIIEVRETLICITCGKIKKVKL